MDPGGMAANASRLGALMRSASVAFHARMDQKLSAARVTTPQFTALDLIERHPGVSSAELSRMSLLTPQTTAVIVANLKRAGAVVALPHPEHGRVRKLELTEAGAETLAACRRMTTSIDVKLEQDFSAEDLVVVRRWLHAAMQL